MKKVLLPGEVRQVTGRLAAVADLVRRARWADAVDDYQRLINEAGDDLVPLEGDGLHAAQRSIQIRRLCHLGIAALPPAALRLYRERVDVQAEKWLRQGMADRDMRPLRRIVDEAFCSRAGAQALDLLGDLAFEKGNLEEAQSWWQMLAPAPAAFEESAVHQLRYPDPSLDLARVMAKHVLARLYQGDLQQAELELKALRRLHPAAAGQLAGRKGTYVDTVQSLIAQARAAVPFPDALDWPTFGGAASRNRPLPAMLSPRLWAVGPAWRVRLTSGERIETPAAEGPEVPATAPPRRLAYHPIIVDDKVFVADAYQVQGFDLLTGRLLFRYQLKAAIPVAKPAHDLGERHTLTAADGCLYARLGAELFGPGQDGAKTEVGPSFLVCLNLRAGEPGRVRWRIPAQGAPGESSIFEGAPLVHDGRVYVAVTRLAGSRTQTALACHDAATGNLRWRQEVCDCPEYEESLSPRPRQHLLTRAGSLIVYCSHAGAIVALDARTGKRTWAVRYPSRGPRTSAGDPSPRDLAPCLYDGVRLYAAPSDSDRVLGLDPETGRVLWERDHVEVVHLLGATQGRLLFTTRSRIRALNSATGGDQGGWTQPDEGKLPGLGRGLVAGGWVFWPTRDPRLPLRVLNVEDGLQERGDEALEPTQLRALRSGNMAAGNGCLVIAGAEELAGYVPPERLLKPPAQEAAPLDRSGTSSLRLRQFPGNPVTQRKAFPDGPGATGPAKSSERLPLLRSWEVAAGRLIVPPRKPLSPQGEELFFARGAELSCRAARTGSLRWRQALPFVPLWIGCHGERILVAGAEGVQSLRLADGQPVWEIALPAARGRNHDLPSETTLSGFQLTTSHLTFFQGERRLFALHVNSGETAWSFWAPGARLRPLSDGGRFYPYYHAGEAGLILQTTGGTRLILNHDGNKVHAARTTMTPWPQPPLPLDPGRVCLVEDAHHVMLLDTTTGKEVWTYRPRAPTALTGEPPRLFGNAQGLCILVPMNFGHELERLDPATGDHVWPAARRISRTAFDGTTVAFDSGAVFYAVANVLHARSLADGKRLWDRPLPAPAGPWQIVRTTSAVAAYPVPDLPAVWARRTRQACLVPVGLSKVALGLPRFGEPPLNDPPGFTTVLHDPADGQPMQRLNFPTVQPWAGVQFLTCRLVVAAEGQAWCLRAAGD